MTFAEMKAEMEKDLYKALEALETDDLITIRQCAARVQSDSREMWNKRRTNEQQETAPTGV